MIKLQKKIIIIRSGSRSELISLKYANLSTSKSLLSACCKKQIWKQNFLIVYVLGPNKGK